MSLKPPILIAGSMRAGKTTLAHVLAELPGVCTFSEANSFLKTGHAFRGSDVASAADARPWVRRHMQRMVLRYQRAHGGARVIIESPFVALKLPFLHAVFPDAKIIHIYRDGRVVMHERLFDEKNNRKYAMVSSRTMSRVRQQLEQMHWRDLLALPLKTARTFAGRYAKQRWYGTRYPGWRQDRHKDPSAIAARQWAASVEIAMASLEQLPQGSWTNVQCEALIANPQAELRRLIDFCGLGADDGQVQSLAQSFRLRVDSLPAASPDDARIEPLMPIMRAPLQRLGYL